MFPILIVYEILIFIDNNEDGHMVINGLDLLTNISFKLIPNNPILFNSLFIAAVYSFILFIYREKLHYEAIKYTFLFTMVIESIFWSILLYFIIINIGTFLLLVGVNSLSKYIQISIGAGIWEELVFRLMLINILLYMCKYIYSIRKIVSIILAISISALIFSTAHYIGSFDYNFTINSFVYRFIAGWFFGFLYLARGYGITVYCHMLFDLFLIINPLYSIES